MDKIDCTLIVEQMKEETINIKVEAIKQAYGSDDIWEKCVLLRKFSSPQSTESEKLLKHDLEIGDAGDNVSGDGIKNGLTYEIKSSLHDRIGSVNIRQIRPHHNVDYYVVLTYNLFESEKGVPHLFRIPSKDMYELVVQYGGYTHGTINKNGVITKESIVGNKTNSCEYSLTPNPNAPPKNKSNKLWQEFLKYEVTYDKNNF